MLFFLNPVTSLVGSLSQEKVLTKAYLGLSEAMNKPITNSIGEFRFYYSRFLGYIIHNLESTIAEIEGKAIAPTPTEKVKALPIPEVELSHPQPKSEALVIEPAQASSTPQPPEITNTEIVEAGEVGEAGETEDSSDWPIPDNQPTPNNNSVLSTEESIAILLECETKLQLMAKKKDIGEEQVLKAWDTMTLVQKNYLQLISLRDNVTKPFATLGYQLAYQPTKDVKPRSSRLIGFYLYGEKLPLADERAILIKGETEPTICRKEYLRPFKDSTEATETEIKLLEKLLTESQESEPTAETIATNTFTGLATPKLPTGSETGNKPESQPSEPNVGVQTELNLKTPEPKEIPPTPTPALEVIASELKRFHPQNKLTFTYETTPHATFLTIKHGDSQVACFEDDGSDIYEVGRSKLTFHGFTEEEVSKAFCAGEDVLESLTKKKA
ncbi:MAG: hypothetical protein F6K24_01480 [Okeania sp. SIO2D1]|nr:hypothetical protein [Okeania sp. SIO2D1]